MGVVVGVAYRDVEHLYPLGHQSGQKQVGLGEVKLPCLGGTEAVGVGHHIRHAEAGGQQEICGDDGLDGTHTIEIEPRAILKASAVATGAVECGQ